MNLKKLHHLSGIVISVFIVLHLANHISSLWGANVHIELMIKLRAFYRNIFAESILLGAVLLQIISGIKLFLTKRRTASNFFDKLQIWSGVYLAFFFIIHLSAVFAGRLILDLDTNFYFGVAGLNAFPFNLFFIPYYSLAILSFFGHLAAIHSKKMKTSLLGFTPNRQAFMILGIATILTITILYGLTNGFHGVEVPSEYNILIGK